MAEVVEENQHEDILQCEFRHIGTGEKISGCSSLAENTPCGEQQLVPHPDDMENDGLAVLTGNEQGLLETGYLVGERCVALAVQATFADGYKALVG